MKKILLGLVAALALSTFVAPAFAQDAPAGGDKPAAADGAKKEKKAKKGKKAKEGDAAAPAAGAEKPAK